MAEADPAVAHRRIEVVSGLPRRRRQSSRKLRREGSHEPCRRTGTGWRDHDANDRDCRLSCSQQHPHSRAARIRAFALGAVLTAPHMNYRPSKSRPFRRIAGTAARVQAVCYWHRALGRDPAQQLLRAWQDYRALSQASAARSPDSDIRIAVIVSFAGLAFSLLAIEHVPAIAASISASSWLISP